MREEKLLNTTGEFTEILGKRKVFVNVTGQAGEKITARLREYGGLEVVRTAREAEFAVHFFYLSEIWVGDGGVIRTVITPRGKMIITIRDPSKGVPRIVWQNEDIDGGRFRKNEAFNKLIERFITELKELEVNRHPPR
ncbi:MAG TPA: hypothetical protein VG148_16870 [Pyrinomonadaceae bacterium]|nr:hypothetical protein [Pyrinomonadaceae bacterium]